MKRNVSNGKQFSSKIPIRISIIYFILSSMWILITDRFIKSQTEKGIFFVFLSSLLIYILVDLNFKRVNRINKEHEEELYHINSIDKLTGLPNITYLEKIYQNMMLSKEYSEFVFLYIDIDSFTRINNIFGFSFGDQLIKELSNSLSEFINEKGVIARIVGDEFCVVLKGFNSKRELDIFINEIQNIIQSPFEIQEEKISFTSTIGIALNPDDGTDFDTLIKKSHIAMQHGKNYNRAGHIYYDVQMEQKVIKNIELLSDIRKGLANNEFKMHYQIIMDIVRNKIIAVEALLRWYHPFKGYIPPLQYIPIAEKTDLIFELVNFIIEEVFRQKSSWNSIGIDIPMIGINISLKSFESNSLVEDIERNMKKYNLSKGEIILELTESGFIEDDTNLMLNIQNLEV